MPECCKTTVSQIAMHALADQVVKCSNRINRSANSYALAGILCPSMNLRRLSASILYSISLVVLVGYLRTNGLITMTYYKTESVPYPPGAPFARDDHRVSWSGCRHDLRCAGRPLMCHHFPKNS